ncbi:MAG: hypothetical protein JWR33_1696 [Naasia sp.]|jgi:TetR/AcrR family transcriptional regulator|uniref:TetR/AcrR family transcriptional regulator n=1 Tax=Naasia sp. TaxID=2546198 RepID=UPI0026347B89|nr:TetR/AcrR family transcriptional regulator [Naasia sp.]MCU1570955.1 hypothetical protein [Naasia sp.]
MANTSATQLRRVALEQFARTGFAGASLGSIGEAAGLSKSSVLYHYASKEALLTAAVAPALAEFAEVVGSYPASGGPEERQRFVERFIDLLLEHRLAVHIFINQGQSLKGIPVIDRANALVHQFGEAAVDHIPSVADRIRFGVALGGAAYTLVATETWSDLDLTENDEIRAALVDTVSGLLADISATAGTH